MKREKCPFCGYEFTAEEAASGCRGCSLSSSCGHTCCPKCGYELALRPWQPPWRRRGRRGGTRPGIGVPESTSMRPLTSLPVGGTGVIAQIGSNEAGVLQKLASLGLFPGRQVKVVQKFPAYVLQIGHILVAIDKDLAAHLEVDIDKGPALDYKNKETKMGGG
ncbi:MAG: ferrous iron transport protein A [Clostridia bacterium]|nr:MAG: ferrous iron transport protein A [Clostridia bacterium]